MNKDTVFTLLLLLGMIITLAPLPSFNVVIAGSSYSYDSHDSAYKLIPPSDVISPKVTKVKEYLNDTTIIRAEFLLYNARIGVYWFKPTVILCNESTKYIVIEAIVITSKPFLARALNYFSKSLPAAVPEPGNYAVIFFINGKKVLTTTMELHYASKDAEAITNCVFHTVPHWTPRGHPKVEVKMTPMAFGHKVEIKIWTAGPIGVLVFPINNPPEQIMFESHGIENPVVDKDKGAIEFYFLELQRGVVSLALVCHTYTYYVDELSLTNWKIKVYINGELVLPTSSKSSTSNDEGTARLYIDFNVYHFILVVTTIAIVSTALTILFSKMK